MKEEPYIIRTSDEEEKDWHDYMVNFPKHNHMTRDIKPEGECPGCDVRRHEPVAPPAAGNVVEYCVVCNKEIHAIITFGKDGKWIWEHAREPWQQQL